MSALRIAFTAYLVLIVAGCGGSQPAADHGDERYPVVTDPPPTHGETVTEGGALVSHPVKPTEYEIEPSASCERQPYKSQSGNGLIIVPPRPGLAAEALSERSVKVSWWFEAVPTDCRPASILISIVANDASGATPTTVTAPFEGQTGEATLAYPEFLPPPDVALVSALMPRGERSRTARVLIRR